MMCDHRSKAVAIPNRISLREMIASARETPNGTRCSLPIRCTEEAFDMHCCDADCSGCKSSCNYTASAPRANGASR